GSSGCTSTSASPASPGLGCARCWQRFDDDAELWYLANETAFLAGETIPATHAALKVMQLDTRTPTPEWVPKPSELYRQIHELIAGCNDPSLRELVAEPGFVVLINEAPPVEMVLEGIDPRVRALALASRSALDPSATPILTGIVVYRQNVARLVGDAIELRREIELAVLGDGGPDTIVSQPGEIILPKGQWYTYETKYEDDVATYAIPAKLPDETVALLQDLALRAFRATRCAGLARIDFLVERDSLNPWLNEVNTMPGFTTISMYPKMMGHSGIGYAELITRLVDLGIAAHRRRAELSITRK
ncbi:MAG: hypothetical protein HC927_05775, partial [Deltaproteobacteria bacterium]|nr:hypothetical protein [Deltaproteobacteria bacterium]